MCRPTVLQKHAGNIGVHAGPNRRAGENKGPAHSLLRASSHSTGDECDAINVCDRLPVICGRIAALAPRHREQLRGQLRARGAVFVLEKHLRFRDPGRFDPLEPALEILRRVVDAAQA